MVWFPHSITSYYLRPKVLKMHGRVIFFTAFILTPLIEAIIMFHKVYGD